MSAAGAHEPAPGRTSHRGPDGGTAAADGPVADGAAAALRAGRVVLLPTDTVYGIAVDPTIPDATQRLFDLKGRGRDTPIAVLVAGPEQAWDLARQPVPPAALRLAERFWPGALTIVVARAPAWHADLGAAPAGGGAPTVGLRCPDHGLVRALCAVVGPLATTSANRHGFPTPPTAAEAAAALGPGLLVVDGGRLGGMASTVVDCTVDPPRVLREGAVPAASVCAALDGPP